MKTKENARKSRTFVENHSEIIYSFEATFVPHPPRSIHRQFFESVAISCSSSQYNIIRLKRNWFSNKLATHKRVQALIPLEKMKRAMKYDGKICQPQNINDGRSVTGSYIKWRNFRDGKRVMCLKYKFQKMLIQVLTWVCIFFCFLIFFFSLISTTLYFR